MLVLSRKCGEKIILPDQAIVVTALEVRGERVRLGIAAPAHVGIHRYEVWQRLPHDASPEGPDASETPAAPTADPVGAT
jgi:carbon storage regulator